jgi:hypothetical protein
MDFVSLLIEAKRLGLDITQIVQFIILYFLLKKDLTKLIDAQFNKLIDAIKSLEKAHNERLNKIEMHVGLKKGE